MTQQNKERKVRWSFVGPDPLSGVETATCLPGSRSCNKRFYFDAQGDGAKHLRPKRPTGERGSFWLDHSEAKVLCKPKSVVLINRY